MCPGRESVVRRPQEAVAQSVAESKASMDAEGPAEVLGGPPDVSPAEETSGLSPGGKARHLVSMRTWPQDGPSPNLELDPSEGH